MYEKPAPGRHPESAPSNDSARFQRGGLWKAVAIFIGQRLLFGAFVLLAIIYITYFAFSVAQGAEVATSLGQAASLTIDYVLNLLKGELGLSQPGSAAFQAQPTMEILPIALMRSLGLLATTFGLAVIVGIPFGIWAAYSQHGRGALIILIISFIGISTPVFFRSAIVADRCYRND